jgi:hypothetical protein
MWFRLAENLGVAGRFLILATARDCAHQIRQQPLED